MEAKENPVFSDFKRAERITNQQTEHQENFKEIFKEISSGRRNVARWKSNLREAVMCPRNLHTWRQRISLKQNWSLKVKLELVSCKVYHVI